MTESKKTVVEKGTLPGCIGTNKPYYPNRCDTCRQHSDCTCFDVRVVQKNRQK